MTALLLEMLGAIFRAGLLFLSGWFVQRGIWTADQADRFSTAASVWAAAAILAVAWSLWAKYKNRVKLLTALDAPAGTTEASLERRIDKGMAAKVTMLLLVLGLGASCASAGKVLVEADRGIHATLAGLDDTVNRACDMKLRPEADCKAFNAALANAFAAHQRYNAAAQEGSIAGVPQMVTALSDLQAAVKDMAPQAQALIDDLKRWRDALAQLLPKGER